MPLDDQGLDRLTRCVLQQLQRSAKEQSRTQAATLQVRVFDDGWLDSVGLLELMAALEAEGLGRVDMLRFDPGEVETGDDLVQALAQALPA